MDPVAGREGAPVADPQEGGHPAAALAPAAGHEAASPPVGACAPIVSTISNILTTKM